MPAPSIGAAMIAIRDARAPWLETEHFAILVALAMRLPTIRPSGAQIAGDARVHVSTVWRILPELKEHGVLAYEGKPGKPTVYFLRLANIERLRPLEPEPIAPSDTSSNLSPPATGQSAPVAPSDRHLSPPATLPVAPSDRKSQGRANQETIRDPTRTPATRPPDLNPTARAWQATHPKPVARKQPGLASTSGRPPVLRKQPAAKRQGTAKGSTTPEPP